MGFALARCLQGAGLAARIVVYDPLAERGALFSRELSGVTVAAGAGEACRAADACFLAVKPQDVAAAAAALGGSDGLIISIVAGVSLARLAARLPRARLVRVMPNTPCLVGAMAAGFAMGAGTGAGDRELVGAPAGGRPEQPTKCRKNTSTRSPASAARDPPTSRASSNGSVPPACARGWSLRSPRRSRCKPRSAPPLLMQQRAIAPGDLVDLVSSPRRNYRRRTPRAGVGGGARPRWSAPWMPPPRAAVN